MNDFVRDAIGTGQDLLDAWGDAQTAALTTHLAYGTPGPKTLVISIAPQGLSVPVGNLIVTHVGPDGKPTTTVRTTAPESGKLYPVSVGNQFPTPGPVLGSVGVTFVPGGGTPPLPPAVGGLRRIVTPLNRGFSALNGGVVIDLSWGESPVEREEIQNPDDGSVTVVHRYTNGGSVRATYTHDESGRPVLQESQIISTDPATGISEATTYVHDASGEAHAALVETGGHAYVPGMERTSANELSLMDQIAEVNYLRAKVTAAQAAADRAARAAVSGGSSGGPGRTAFPLAGAAPAGARRRRPGGSTTGRSRAVSRCRRR